MIDLSILICSTHTRYQTFAPKIQDQLFTQYNALSSVDQDRVEIMMLTDNKKMILGDKRNAMVDLAQGKYVQFIDDDDRVAPDLIKTILDATVSNADVISFRVEVFRDDKFLATCFYSKDFKDNRNIDPAKRHERLPNHICCVKRKLAKQARFPSMGFGEDTEYAHRLKPLLKTEYEIPQVLYYYDFRTEVSETQSSAGTPLVRPRLNAEVDIVILSNAKSRELQLLTLQTIKTCKAGAGRHDINIIVVEQQACTYQDAYTLRMPGQFNYNAFANRGAQQGNAKWIMVANNDLVFERGWLDALLAANHPLVSPKSPGDPRQIHVTTNTKGYQNGTNLSGWCFMITRDLWRRMDGFDDCVSFWCSDDVVVEQARRCGVEPMLVPASEVRHLGSKTLSHAQDYDDLTWRQLDVFNRKYGPHALARSEQFKAWKARQR